jgi:hypothetical protein
LSSDRRVGDRVGELPRGHVRGMMLTRSSAPAS